MLRLDDLWVWDSWVADDGDLYHLFFLQAPRALEDPGKRHTAATVGHATSPDLVDWTYLGECFGPDRSGAPRFDDLAIWTGSVVHDGERWRMFYTAVSNAGHHVYDQRVGCGRLRRPAALAARRPRAGRARRRPLVQEPRQHPGPHRGPGPRGLERDLARPARLRRPGRRRLAHVRQRPRPRRGPQRRRGGRPRHQPRPRDLDARAAALRAGRRVRPAGGVAEQADRRSLGAGLHLPPAGDDRRADRPHRRVLHLVGARRRAARARGTSTPHDRSAASRTSSPRRWCSSATGRGC